MSPQREDLLLVGIVALVGLASLATWMFLAIRWLQRGAVLPYESRRPVPWGIWATLLVVVLTLGNVFAALERPVQTEAEPAVSTSTRVARFAGAMLLQVGFVGVFTAAVVVISQATKRDVGLPANFGEACRDVATGVLACLAAYVPVLIVRVLTVVELGDQEDHPLIRLVKKQPSDVLFAAAAFAAVVVAPICEEVSFRLLLQGWLEKWEDAVLGWRVASNSIDAAAGELLPADALLSPANADAPALENLLEPIPEPSPAPENLFVEPAGPPEQQQTTDVPPIAGVARMPHGWLPIIVSSTLFALAHVGNSTDAFPLYVLALFLGLLYQRTHRILPSIAAHATFNLISMLLLWRMMYGPMAGR